MHVKSEKDQVEIGVQGQCTISCIIFQIVKMVHAVIEDPKRTTQSN